MKTRTTWSIPDGWTELLTKNKILGLFPVILLLALASPQATRSQTSEKSSRECDTPLQAAVHKHDSSEAIRLIKSGVDLKAKPCGETALFEATVYGDTKVVEELLSEGAAPNMLDDLDSSPLSAAAFYCREDILPLLIAHGADVILLIKMVTHH